MTTTSFKPTWKSGINKYVNFNPFTSGASMMSTTPYEREIDLARAGDGSIYVLCATHYQKGDTYGQNILLVKYDAQGNRQWHTELGNDAHYEQAGCIDVDRQGNVYIAGARSLTVGNNRSLRAFVASYTPEGKRRWEYRERGIKPFPRVPEFSSYHDMVVTDDSVYLTGGVRGEVDRRQRIRKSEGDILVTRLRLRDGRKAWSTQVQGPPDTYSRTGHGITEHNGRVYVAGVNRKETKDAPGNVSGTDRDGLVLCFSASGVLRWERTLGVPLALKDRWPSGHAERATTVAVDSSGDVYVTGMSNGALDPDLPAMRRIQTMPMLAKYTRDGRPVWVRQVASAWTSPTINRMSITEDDRILVAAETSMRGKSMLVLQYNTRGDLTHALRPDPVDQVTAEAVLAFEPTAGKMQLLIAGQELVGRVAERTSRIPASYFVVQTDLIGPPDPAPRGGGRQGDTSGR